MELILRQIPNDYKLKKRYLDAHSSEIETLILGSSHSYYDVDPKYIDLKAYNAAFVSQSFDYDYKILKKYSGNWRNLKYIIIPISYFSLNYTTETGGEKWRVKNYSIYFDIGSTCFTDYSEILSNNLFVNTKRCYKYYIKDESNITSMLNGWGKLDNSSRDIGFDLLSDGKRMAKLHTMKNKILFTENTNTLISLIEFADKMNVDVVFFTAPAFHTYYENFDSTQWIPTLNYVKEISKKYSNSYYFNFLTDTAFAEVDFFDAHHLNETGAEKLTKKLNLIIKEIRASKESVHFNSLK